MRTSLGESAEYKRHGGQGQADVCRVTDGVEAGFLSCRVSGLSNQVEVELGGAHPKDRLN